MLRSIQSFIFVLLLLRAQALRFDDVPSIGSRPVQDRQLQDYIRTSVRWLQFRAVYNQYTLLNLYAEQLQLVLRTECAHCVDYYEAAGMLGLLGKTVNQIMKDAKDDTHYPVVRRSYIAAVWLLQRSKQFLWDTTHLPNTALSTMFRLYLGHVHRAKGRTVSLHHISKCGGTTMCQLAASNRCSNPHLSQEKNCVLNDRLDGPLWMVGHNVAPQGVILNPAIGTLDSEPVNLPSSSSKRRFANEPKMDMWLMYACPYAPNGKIYNCDARAADAHESGTTFLANERTLTRESGMTQVCSEFLNTVILREPVPHAISIMAEVKYRYVRQMAVKHSIESWQPTAWNLTWWEALGPALVGNYATRTLIGRESLCRSAENMGKQQLQDAMDSLLSFDMVMTLGRSQDIDLVITTLLGWPARNFSSQPGARVREVSVDLATKGEVAVGDSKASKGGSSGGARHLMALDDTTSSSHDSSNNSGEVDDWVAEVEDEQQQLSSSPSRSLLAANQPQQQKKKKPGGGAGGKKPKHTTKHALHALHKKRAALKGKAGKQNGAAAGAAGAAAAAAASSDLPAGAVIMPARMLGNGNISSSAGAAGDLAGAASSIGVNLTPAQLEQQAAVMLVSTTWHERQAELLGVLDKAAVQAITGKPAISDTGKKCKHGSHLVSVAYKNKGGLQVTETWHSFPRHTFAFLDSDVAKLEKLTQLDMQVYKTADLMFNLDTVWLQAMLSSSHYRKKLRGVVATQTSCGFAGMIPVDPALLKEPQVSTE